MSNYCYNCMEKIEEGQVCKHCGCTNAIDVLPHHLTPGQLLNGKYLVGKSIGEGGFGITYIGRDIVLDIKVAIKEFFPNGYANRNNTLTQDVTAPGDHQQKVFELGKSRFLDEAKNVAKFIGESGVVGVREYFEVNGTAYIIMEHLDGVTLSKHIKKYGPFDSEQLFRLMLPIMNSLNKIHQAGIIHRDISPDNIMYLSNGTLKLMDFGSARYFTNEEKEMSIMLKRGYAPEEQYRKNSKQGPWTDVYGLCATIYRCITGVIPEDALDRAAEDTLRKPNDFGINIDPQLESILLYGMAVYAQHRCPDMTRLKELTEKALNNVLVNINPSPVSTSLSNPQPQKTNNIPQKQSVANHTPPKKKSATGAIIAFVSVILVLAIATAGVFIYLQNNNADKSDQSYNDVASSYDTTDPDYDNAYEFVSASASSTLEGFSADNLLVNDDTCWTEGVDGYGEGQWIQLDLPETQTLNGLHIVNGFAGTREEYEKHSRPNLVEIEFSNGRSTTIALKPLESNQRKSINIVDFTEPVNTDFVRINIVSVYEGETENTSITYVKPI